MAFAQLTYRESLRDKASYGTSENAEDPDLDRSVGLCAGGDHTQALGTGGQSLPNATDSERHAFRETPILCTLQAGDVEADFAENVNQLILIDF
jgi:hypothetical protein